MKRLFALLLTLAMLLGSAAMAEFDYTGLWTLTSAEAAGITLDPAAIGLNVSMLLNEDGSCVLTMLDETQNGTWAATATGITTTDAEGVVDTYTLVNSSLVIEQEGVKIIFARGVEDENNYVGTWTLESMEIAGMAQNLSKEGISGGVVLNEDGSCVLSFQDVTANGTWAATETGITTTETGGAVDTYTLVDGKLVLEMGTVKMTFARVAEKNQYVGSWALTSMQFAGMTLDSEMLKHFDADISLIINEDGTCKMVSISDNETQVGTWKETEAGIVLTDTSGESQTFHLVDGALVTTVIMMTDGELDTEQDGATMIFTHVLSVEDATTEPVADAAVEPETEAAAEKIDYVGMWALTGMKTPDMTVDSTELSMDATLSIYEDGTWKMTSISGNETVEGTWEETEGGIVLTSTLGEFIPFTFTDGALVAEGDGMTLIFTLVESVPEPETEPVVEPETESEMDPLAEEEYAEPLAGLTMADFNGEWAFVDAEYMGQVLDAEMLGMSIDLRIQDGKGHAEMTFADGTDVRDAVCEIEEIEELGTVMYFFFTDPATGETTESGMVLMLYSDGELVWCAADEEEEDKDIFYNFEKVANVSD